MRGEETGAAEVCGSPDVRCVKCVLIRRLYACAVDLCIREKGKAANSSFYIGSTDGGLMHLQRALND